MMEQASRGYMTGPPLTKNSIIEPPSRTKHEIQSTKSETNSKRGIRMI
jgi:hypothetical protein